MQKITPELFQQHLAKRISDLEEILAESDFLGLVIGAGEEQIYFDDDASVPFRSNPHFLHYCPARGHNHMLILKPKRKPKLLFYRPNDYWHEMPGFQNEVWIDGFDIEVMESSEAIWKKVEKLKNHAYIGAESGQAKKRGFKTNPKNIMHALHWLRGVKSDYEIACLKNATELAAKGHQAAYDGFLAGDSELQIHQRYLAATLACDQELPYPSIIGLNEKGAILHYQNRRHPSRGDVLLIDAGCRYQFYGSDITRTHCKKNAHPVFRSLVDAMNKMQIQLFSQLRAGVEYVELHIRAHEELAEILTAHQIIKGLDARTAVDKGVSSAFFPHGLGHLLGIEVHDVGGMQINKKGKAPKPNPRFPKLRLQRALRAGEVVTVEPGLYFIPMLLDSFRKHKLADKFNWPLIDALIPCGGIRIEDNILIKADDRENLTRQVGGILS